jgi:Predicted membrane protein
MVLNYGDLTLKFIIGFLIMVLQINLFGRGNIAPTSAIDQLQNYVLGGIVGGMIYNSSITIMQFTMVLLIWTMVVFVAKFLTNHNNFFKKVIEGTPQLIHQKWSY